MSENTDPKVVEETNVQPVPAEPEVVTDDVQVDEEPVEPEHGNYDVRFQPATEEDAVYDVEETNSKEDVTDE